jgi:hypothetical protein
MLLNGLMKAGVGKRMGSGTNSKGVHILDLTPAPLKMASLPRIPRIINIMEFTFEAYPIALESSNHRTVFDVNKMERTIELQALLG